MGLFDLIDDVIDTGIQIVKLPVSVVRDIIPDDEDHEIGERTLKQIKKIIKADK